MSIETKRLILIPHHPAHLLALAESDLAYEKNSGNRVAEGVRESLLSASPEFLARLKEATDSDPWQFGFGVFHKIDTGACGSRATWTGKPARVDEPGGESIKLLMGMCGFPGPPDSNGAAEIAYGIAPSYRGKGYATESAQALVDFASSDPRVKLICAHTLAEPNASTRILEKCGFKKTSQTIDPETNLPVWRWERSTSTS
jgi:RimJ/RimL family protein N-acetyltransferase